jgi:LysM repeat protein
MPRSRMFGIYALVAVVALSAGLLIARVFGSSPNLPAGYVTPSPVIGEAETATATSPLSPTLEATRPPSATPAPSVTAEAVIITPSVTPPIAAATPTPPPTAPPSYIEYVVQRGDILRAIAQKYGVTVEEILAINQIPNPDSLNVASVIRIPIR